MPVVIHDESYYPAVQVCRMVGIRRKTLLSLLKEGTFPDVEYQNWRGWRLSTAAQVETSKTKTNDVLAISRSS